MSQDPKRKMKLVVRHLPWSLPEDKFREVLGDAVLAHVEYFAYEAGKQTTKRKVDSCCMLGFTDVERLHQFADAFHGKVFVDHKGRELTCQVEFAMHQRIPKSRAPDPRKNTLDADPEFQAFCRGLAEPPAPAPSAERWLEEREREAKDAAPAPLAPLVQELLERRRHYRRKARGGDWDDAPRKGGRRSKASRYAEEEEETGGRAKASKKGVEEEKATSKRAEKESKKEKEKAKEKEKEKDKGKKGRVADEWGYEDPSRWEDKGPERASQGAKKWKDDEWDWDADRRGERAGKDGGKGGAWSRSGRWDAERGYGGREEWDPRWADSYGREDWYGRRGGGKEKGGGWYDPKGEWSASRPSGRSWDDEWAPEWEWDASSSKAPAKPSTRDRGKEKGRDREEAERPREGDDRGAERDKRRETER
eukprot:EG_transcript_13333